MIRSLWRFFFGPPPVDLQPVGLLMRRVEVSDPAHADAIPPAAACSRCGCLYMARPVGSKLIDSTRCRTCDRKLSEAAASRRVLTFGARQ